MVHTWIDASSKSWLARHESEPCIQGPKDEEKQGGPRRSKRSLGVRIRPRRRSMAVIYCRSSVPLQRDSYQIITQLFDQIKHHTRTNWIECLFIPHTGPRPSHLTNMVHVQRAKANKYNFAIAFFVALGSFTYGFNSAIIGSVIGQPSFFLYFGFSATSAQGGRIVGASNGLYAGAGCLGCWTVFWLMDKLGRKQAIIWTTILCIISAAIQAGATGSIAMFLVGRFLNGWGVGFINCIIPTYLSEVSPPAQRGRIVGSHGFIICAAYVSVAKLTLRFHPL